MYRKMALTEKINEFDYKKTKMNVSNYFANLEKLKWEQARLNIQKGLTAKCDNSNECKKQQIYISVGRDEFNLSARAEKDEELRKYLSGYYWAKSILSEEEQLYIKEYFVNGKYENEVVGLLGLNSIDSRSFRKLKRRAIYKFAYVLNLVV